MLHWFAKRLNELHKEDRKGEKGFTLIELLVVVIIIGVLAAIAIPVFLNQRASAQQSAAKSDLRNGAAAATACASDPANNGSYVNCNEAALVNTYGWNQTANVDSAVTTNTATRWVATANHTTEGTVYTFDSDTGTITP